MKNLCLSLRLLVKLLIFIAIPSFSQTQTVSINLHKLANEKGVDVFNRSISLVEDSAHPGIRLDEKDRDGLAWLKHVEFSNGTLEFDVKGKDIQGQSFVGLAFHGSDNNTFDAVYLRPFNFRSSDKVRRSHCVQYISHPMYTWDKLRADFPNKYENTIEPAPDPDSWVHVRIEIASPKVSVFINGNTAPSLVVEKLTSSAKGTLGFFVGNGSGGEFANLKITSSK
jgi:hypothetical protein